MTVVATAPDKLDIGAVIKGTFGVLGRNFVTFLVLSLLLAGLPALIWGAGAAQLVGGRPAAGMAAISIGGLVALVSTFVLQGALVQGTIADLNGRRASVGECLATGLRNFLPLIAIALLAAIALMFGFLLLIVPGLMMLCAWCVMVPAQVAERTGVFAAFGRSAQLTRDNRWRVFALLILVWIVSAIIQTVLLGATGGFTPNPERPFEMNAQTLLVNPLISLLSAMIGGTGVAVLYYELRRTKEGIGPEALASVFD